MRRGAIGRTNDLLVSKVGRGAETSVDAGAPEVRGSSGNER